MKKIHRIGAQGDILLVAVASMPENVKPGVLENGKYIVAHSETGHHHVLDRAKAEVFEAADNEFIAYIKTLGEGAEITHERSHDTHETIALDPYTIYRVHRQREGQIDAWRKAAD